MACSGKAPVNSAFTAPSTNIFTAGMPRMPYCWERLGLRSELTLTRRQPEPFSRASLSNVGPRMRHGPHQGAQKSTTTGFWWLLSSTSVRKKSGTDIVGVGLNRFVRFGSTERAGSFSGNDISTHHDKKDGKATTKPCLWNSLTQCIAD